MIGKICSAITPYYDISNRRNRFKLRPVLIIGKADKDDYNALPISTVSKKQNIDIKYDILIDPTVYPDTQLNKKCYVRCHKQTIVHGSHLKLISDLSACYPELYKQIIFMLSDYNARHIIPIIL